MVCGKIFLLEQWKLYWAINTKKKKTYNFWNRQAGLNGKFWSRKTWQNTTKYIQSELFVRKESSFQFFKNESVFIPFFFLLICRKSAWQEGNFFPHIHERKCFGKQAPTLRMRWPTCSVFPPANRCVSCDMLLNSRKAIQNTFSFCRVILQCDTNNVPATNFLAYAKILEDRYNKWQT